MRFSGNVPKNTQTGLEGWLLLLGICKYCWVNHEDCYNQQWHQYVLQFFFRQMQIMYTFHLMRKVGSNFSLRVISVFSILNLLSLIQTMVECQIILPLRIYCYMVIKDLFFNTICTHCASVFFTPEITNIVKLWHTLCRYLMRNYFMCSFY